jgi:hypothetical protein
MNMPGPPPSQPWSQPQTWSVTDVSEDVEAPSSIRLAVRLMWVGAVLSLVRILAVFFQAGDIRREVVESSTEDLTPSQLDAAVVGALTIAGLIGVGAVALWIWMAAANEQGRAWARTTATVLGVLNVLFTLVGMAAGQMPVVGLLISLATVAVAVTVLVLLYKPESSRWYDQRSL